MTQHVSLCLPMKHSRSSNFFPDSAVSWMTGRIAEALLSLCPVFSQPCRTWHLIPPSKDWRMCVMQVMRNQPGLSDKPWWEWPEGLRFREPAAIKEFRWGCMGLHGLRGVACSCDALILRAERQI